MVLSLEIFGNRMCEISMVVCFEVSGNYLYKFPETWAVLLSFEAPFSCQCLAGFCVMVSWTNPVCVLPVTLPRYCRVASSPRLSCKFQCYFHWHFKNHEHLHLKIFVTDFDNYCVSKHNYLFHFFCLIMFDQGEFMKPKLTQLIKTFHKEIDSFRNIKKKKKSQHCFKIRN